MALISVHDIAECSIYINHCKCSVFNHFPVVTGSSEGIGKAYARELAKRGVNVILISRGENRLYRTAKEIGRSVDDDAK